MRLFLAIRSLFFVVLLPGTVAGYIPYRILGPDAGTRVSWVDPISWAALALIGVGTTVLLLSVWEFFSSGQGTLAPIDPPRHLVVRGLYRFTRNPMYNGVAAVVFGEAWLFHSGVVLRYGLLVVVLFHLFVLLYEEPVLTAKFGPEYQRYRAAVPRWGFARRAYTRPPADCA